MDPGTGEYNKPFLSPGMELICGYRRLQGFVFRSGDLRFEGLSTEAAVASARAHSGCLMVGRNAGSGTRILIDRLLAGDRPAGYWSQPNSHNAVAVAVALGRADWGMAIETVARQYDLGFIPVQDEHYDFVVPISRAHRPPVQRFRSLLQEPLRRACPSGWAALIADGFGITPTAQFPAASRTRHDRTEQAKLAHEDHVSAMLLAGAHTIEYDECLNDHKDGLEHLASHCRGHGDADDFARPDRLA
jgi:molybdate-binding protein